MPRLEPVDATFLDTAPNRVVESVDIRASRGDAWAAIVDQPGWASWFPNMSTCVGQPSTWTAVGNTRIVSLGPIKVHERAIVVEPETEWGFTVVAWPLPIVTKAAEAVRLADGPNGGTTLTYVGAFEPNRFGAAIWPVARKGFAKAWSDAFRGLDEHLSG